MKKQKRGRKDMKRRKNQKELKGEERNLMSSYYRKKTLSIDTHIKREQALNT